MPLINSGGACSDSSKPWMKLPSQMVGSPSGSSHWNLFTAITTIWLVDLDLGQRQVLDEVGVGQAMFLLTGLPPFLRVKELRAKNRGDLMLGSHIQC